MGRSDHIHLRVAPGLLVLLGLLPPPLAAAVTAAAAAAVEAPAVAAGLAVGVDGPNIVENKLIVGDCDGGQPLPDHARLQFLALNVIIVVRAKCIPHPGRTLLYMYKTKNNTNKHEEGERSSFARDDRP